MLGRAYPRWHPLTDVLYPLEFEQCSVLLQCKTALVAKIPTSVERKKLGNLPSTMSSKCKTGHPLSPVLCAPGKGG